MEAFRVAAGEAQVRLDRFGEVAVLRAEAIYLHGLAALEDLERHVVQHGPLDRPTRSDDAEAIVVLRADGYLRGAYRGDSAIVQPGEYCEVIIQRAVLHEGG